MMQTKKPILNHKPSIKGLNKVCSIFTKIFLEQVLKELNCKFSLPFSLLSIHIFCDFCKF